MSNGQGTTSLKVSNLPRKFNGKRTQWSKGQSGNPKGRPKEKNSWAKIYNNILNCKRIDIRLRTNDDKIQRILIDVESAIDTQMEIGEINIKKMIAIVVALKALQGDMNAVKEIADRTEGKPAQKTIVEEEEKEELMLTDEQLLKVRDSLLQQGIDIYNLGGSND